MMRFYAVGTFCAIYCAESLQVDKLVRLVLNHNVYSSEGK